MASCVRNICAKNYQNLLICFQVTVENVEDVFFGTQRSYKYSSHKNQNIVVTKMHMNRDVKYSFTVLLLGQQTWLGHVYIY